jgi:hypothetical protein
VDHRRPGRKWLRPNGGRTERGIFPAVRRLSKLRERPACSAPSRDKEPSYGHAAAAKAGSDRPESSLAKTGLDADRPLISFGKLPRASENFSRPSENVQFPSDSFQKFHWETFTHQSFTPEFAG